MKLFSLHSNANIARCEIKQWSSVSDYKEPICFFQLARSYLKAQFLIFKSWVAVSFRTYRYNKHWSRIQLSQLTLTFLILFLKATNFKHVLYIAFCNSFITVFFFKVYFSTSPCNSAFPEIRPWGGTGSKGEKHINSLLIKDKCLESWTVNFVVCQQLSCKLLWVVCFFLPFPSESVTKPAKTG